MDIKSTVLAGLLILAPAPFDSIESNVTKAYETEKHALIAHIADKDFKQIQEPSTIETVELEPPKPAPAAEVKEQKYEQSYTTRTVKITHYCPCYTCNGNNLRRGKWGAYLREGMVASKDLPRGTKVKINNRIYTVEDRCAKSGVIDIFVDGPHRRVYAMGAYRTTVQIFI